MADGLNQSIVKPKVIFTEGSDDFQLLDTFVASLQLTYQVQIIPVNGKDRIARELKAYSKQSSFSIVQTCVIICDADVSYSGTSESMKASFRSADLEVPDYAE